MGIKQARTPVLRKGGTRRSHSSPASVKYSGQSTLKYYSIRMSTRYIYGVKDIKDIKGEHGYRINKIKTEMIPETL